MQLAVGQTDLIGRDESLFADADRTIVSKVAGNSFPTDILIKRKMYGVYCG